MTMESVIKNGKSDTGSSVPMGEMIPVGGATKRMLDCIVAGLAALFFAPLIVLVAILVRCTSRGPVVYAHPRIGFGGKTFKCYKFRSMVMDGDRVLEAHLAAHPEARAEWEASRKLRCDPRVTRVGRFLRKSSLDELPQLFNILRGDMSVVGPRPIVTAEIAKYGPSFADYVRTRPGLTGLWQISGRSDISYDARVRLDVRYVRDWSLPKDVKIILYTVPAVLMQEGSV